ncbi:hypothetical protein J6590_046493 [Homalodisca vitripennis]|nr:hypothetical protein J6590_046493 [Homalodisca vitripennis]
MGQQNFLHPEEGTEDRLGIGPTGQLCVAFSIKWHSHSRQPTSLPLNGGIFFLNKKRCWKKSVQKCSRLQQVNPAPGFVAAGAATTLNS